jgi:hypothetical protein
MSLLTLAHDLSNRSNKTGQLVDLDKAVLLGREALMLLPLLDPHRSTLLYNLSLDLSNRFDKLAKLQI